MKHNNIIVVDNSLEHIELFENIIPRVDPEARCVSFIYGDEALDIINNQMRVPPSHIFIDAGLKRTTISSCLRSLRGNKALDNCCITVLSDIMPVAVADVYCRMGADFAFARPISVSSGVDLLQCVLPAQRHISPNEIANGADALPKANNGKRILQKED